MRNSVEHNSSVYIDMIVQIFDIICILTSYIFFSNIITDPVTGSSCYNDRRDRLTTFIPR